MRQLPSWGKTLQPRGRGRGSGDGSHMERGSLCRLPSTGHLSRRSPVACFLPGSLSPAQGFQEACAAASAASRLQRGSGGSVPPGPCLPPALQPGTWALPGGRGAAGLPGVCGGPSSFSSASLSPSLSLSFCCSACPCFQEALTHLRVHCTGLWVPCMVCCSRCLLSNCYVPGEGCRGGVTRPSELRVCRPIFLSLSSHFLLVFAGICKIRRDRGAREAMALSFLLPYLSCTCRGRNASSPRLSQARVPVDTLVTHDRGVASPCTVNWEGVPGSEISLGVTAFQ